MKDDAPYGLAALATAVVLAIYLATLAPTTQFWDTSEYIAAAKVLGIPHPPGNPLFVLLAHVWGLIPLAEHYALRINLFGAVTSALASGLLFLVAERWLRTVLPEPRWARYGAAFAGVLVGATSFTVWNQSVVNEKVYTVSLLSIALVLWLTVRWADEPPSARRDHWLILIAYLLALTATNHLMGLLVAPAVLAYVLYTDRVAPRRWRIWLAVLVVAAVGLSVFTFLPLRAAHYPAINEGEPTTWEAFWAVLNREQYQKPPVVERQADLVWQYAHYLQYFAWQFGHDWSPAVRRLLAVLFAALGLAGAAHHWRRDRRGAVAMTAVMATLTLLLGFYLNFKYGYSVRAGENLLREVRERDYFFVASFQLWGLWVALGLGAALQATAHRLSPRIKPPGAWYAAAPILLLGLVPLWGNRLSASRAGETFPRDFAIDLLQSVEPHAILITTGDNDTFPLWYAQEVEGVRRDVTVANTALMNTLWHVRQLKRRGVIPFDTAHAASPYRGRAWPAPATPVLRMDYEQIDLLPELVTIPGVRAFRAGTIRAMLRPELLPHPGLLQRADLVTLQLIQDNLGVRPIYFSRTVGGYPEALGLGPYLIGHGLTRKLEPDTVGVAPDSVVHIEALGWVDIPRTDTLLFGLYHPESAARDRPRGWIDEPSEGILTLYGVLYLGFANYLAAKGDRARADHAAEWGRRILMQTSVAAALTR